MSKVSEQMEKMTIDDISANPCGYCYACKWTSVHDCYEGNPAQCSICSIILSVIEKSKQSVASEVAKAELAMLDRLEGEQEVFLDDTTMSSGYVTVKAIPLSALTNERNKLKGKK